MTETQKRILVTDDSPVIVKTLERVLTSLGYEVFVARDGEECLRLAQEKRPALAFLDLMLPKLQGIDVLKRLKADANTRDMGVVISTSRSLSQDYRAAIDHGACYFLTKPFLPEAIGSIVQRYFAHTLRPAPFAVGGDADTDSAYETRSKKLTRYAKLWGTRGSIPVSGGDYTRYGGSTPCLELVDGEELVIIDAGTGIRQLGNEVLERKGRTIHLVLGHTHWDHILGFPFFAPVYDRDFTIHIYAAQGSRKSTAELFSGMLDHDYFPVRLDEMRAKLVFHNLQDHGPLEIGKMRIHYDFTNHPGPTLGFKIETEAQTFGYVTDNEILLGYHGHPNRIDLDHPLLNSDRHLIDFFRGCNLLIHEAQYNPQEYVEKVGWGHSSVTNATVLLKYCEVPEWIVTHHDPSHTDEMLEQKIGLHRTILQECNVDCRVRLAYDGLVLPI